MDNITIMSSTIASKLNDLITAKNSMKSALIEKGVTPTGGLSTYADAISAVINNDENRFVIPPNANFCCAPFVTVPQIVIDYIKDRTLLNSLFYMCKKLVSVQLFDTSKVTKMSSMFYDCESLTAVPLFDTSSVTDMSYMFGGCSSLQSVPHFNTSNVTDMSNMFNNCDSLTAVPQFDTSNVTNMGSMFFGCDSLTAVPQFDTSNVTSINSMFYDCESLTVVPQFDTSNVTDMSNAFNGCSSLTTVPQLDASKVSSLSQTFYFCTKLTDIGGLLNLGMQPDLTIPGASTGLFYNCKNITRESCINIFNGLYDRATAGYSILKIYLHTDVMNRLTDEDIAIATNKGWIIRT